MRKPKVGDKIKNQQGFIQVVTSLYESVFRTSGEGIKSYSYDNAFNHGSTWQFYGDKPMKYTDERARRLIRESRANRCNASIQAGLEDALEERLPKDEVQDLLERLNTYKDDEARVATDVLVSDAAHMLKKLKKQLEDRD